MPGAAHSIRLGQFAGVVHYTVEPDGHRIVATLAPGATDQPIRFIATLAAGQRVVISVPRLAGQPPLEFEMSCDGDAVFVSEPASGRGSDPQIELITPASAE
jgi:hypothetical protein